MLLLLLQMLSRHKSVIAGRGLDSICGRIYISAQGINCQGGGLREHTEVRQGQQQQQEEQQQQSVGVDSR
jgi:predicted sulfurtransferase